MKVLFVCHGNICRSPMAEFILRRYVNIAGLSENIEVSSAATSDEEIGNPVYPLAKRTLAMHGIGCRNKVAQRITRQMYDDSDIVVAMDRQNLTNLGRLLGNLDNKKTCLLLDFLPEGNKRQGQDIADPWYTRDFETAYNDIDAGCKGLVDHLKAGIQNNPQ